MSFIQFSLNFYTALIGAVWILAISSIPGDVNFRPISNGYWYIFLDWDLTYEWKKRYFLADG